MSFVVKASVPSKKIYKTNITFSCEKFLKDFSVALGGVNDIEHLGSQKHEVSDQDNWLIFFNWLIIFQRFAAAERAWAYHTVLENHNSRSNYRASSWFERKISSIPIKYDAITVTALASIVTS